MLSLDRVAAGRFAAAGLTLAAALAAWPTRPAAGAPKADEVKAVSDRAVAYLKGKQNEDGSLAPKAGGPGVTALAVAGLVRNGYGPDNPVVAGGLKYLEGNVQKDGGVYSERLANYTTCLALVAFKEANADGKYDRAIDNAAKFVKSLQYGEGTDPKDVKFGGVGYDRPGPRGRPDLSNTHFLVEALLASGLPKDDPSVKNALAFVGRSQNLPGEYNDQPFAGKAAADDRGGFVYNPGDQSNDKSDKRTAAGGLRSEGGMTYAGLKSFLYAGVGKNDPRVKAAVEWVRKHYTLAENPGMGTAGLFYYYHTFAKAMDALGKDEFVDAKGAKHDWRQELFDELKKRQTSDGSWANDNRAFFENQPELATAFAILSLSYCKGK